MNIFKSFYRWLFNLDKKKQELPIAYPLEKELIDRDTIIKKLVKKLSAQDAQLSKVSAEEKLKEEEESEEEREQKLIKKVKEQVREVEEKKYGGSFSFGEFYSFLLKNPRLREKLEITDRNDTKIFGKYGDFVILPDTCFGVTTSDGELVSYGKTLRHVIYKPESLGNHIRRGRIPLPCDKNGIFFPDIEEHKLPESIYDKQTGKIKWAKISEKPLKQLIIDRDRRIVSDSQYIERLEKTKSDLARNNNKLEREIQILKDNKETTRVELSKSIHLQKQYYRKLGTLQNKIVILEEKKKVLENLRNRLEEVNKKLLAKVEEIGAQTKFKEILGLLQGMIEWSAIQTGDKIIKEEKKQDIPKTSTKQQEE